jgi:hypothetical protein
MKNFSFSLLAISFSLLIGCASHQAHNDANSCDVGSRSPSSLTCEKIFLEGSSLDPKYQAIIDSLPAYFEKVASLHYFKDALNDHSLSVDYTKSTVAGEDLYEDYVEGSPTTKIFLQVGYRIDRVPKPNDKTKIITVLRPPSSMLTMYQHIYEQILKNTNNGMTLDDLILPALVFERTRPDGTKEYQLSRPGIDPIPLPEDGWNTTQSNPQLSLTEFALALSQGKMPFEPMMYSHDIAHIADYIHSPKLMRKHREFAKIVYQKSLQPELKPANSDAGNYLNEFLMFPNLEKRTEWKNLLQVSGKKTTAEARLLVLNQQYDSGELFKRIEKIKDSFYDLFELHGGGMHDGASLRRFGDVISIIASQAKYRKLGEPYPNTVIYLRGSAWGLMKQLTLLKDSMQGKSSSSDLRSLNASIEDVPPENIKWLMTNLMYKFEQSVNASLSYGMSADQLYTDLLSANFQATTSYHYYKNSFPPNTLEHQLFIQGEYLPH